MNVTMINFGRSTVDIILTDDYGPEHWTVCYWYTDLSPREKKISWAEIHFRDGRREHMNLDVIYEKASLFQSLCEYNSGKFSSEFSSY